jgi:signal transduction histidine kinase
VRAVASGHFDVSVEIKNRDEIGALANDFNTMVTEIGSLDRMRRDFVSNVSHEFRTPITSIRGFAKLIGENAEDSEAVRSYSDTIVCESERLIALSSNLLRLSELDSMTIHSDTEFSLDEQLRQVVLAHEPLWEPKGIEFDIDLPKVTYTGDEELLRQVWINLIQNAIKFSANERGVIKVELAPHQNTVQVVISDNGKGISEEDLPHVFDRFYKGKKNTDDSGSGLGLSIVQKIVQFLGGSITVQSEDGKGATFTLLLPKQR